MASSCGTLTIEPAFKSGNVLIPSCTSPSPSTATVDEQVTVEATVQNDNPQQATVDVVFSWGGTEVARKTGVTVAGNSSTTVSASFVPSQQGVSVSQAQTNPVQASPASVAAAAPGSARASSILDGCSGCAARSRAMTRQYRRIAGKARRVAPGRGR